MKIRNPQSSIRNEKGQAMVEYVLVVMVFVTTLWGAGALWSSAFKGSFNRLARIVASPAP